MTTDGGNRLMACLSAIRRGREWFDTKVAEHAKAHFSSSSGDSEKDTLDEVIATVRSDNAYHVAEFFYVAWELQLLTRERLPQLIARHNADMKELSANRDRMRNLGLSPQRVEKAVFSIDQEKKIFEDQGYDGQGPIHLDQSDISNLLAPLMSPESCRTILRRMARAGLLHSWGAGRKFIDSKGILERYFAEHLRMIDDTIRDGPGG